MTKRKAIQLKCDCQSLTIIEKKYPNGSAYLEFTLADTIIGSATMVDGGYLVQGKRKPVPTSELAARDMITDRIRAARKSLEKWEKLLGAL